MSGRSRGRRRTAGAPCPRRARAAPERLPSEVPALPQRPMAIDGYGPQSSGRCTAVWGRSTVCQGRARAGRHRFALHVPRGGRRRSRLGPGSCQSPTHQPSHAGPSNPRPIIGAHHRTVRRGVPFDRAVSQRDPPPRLSLFSCERRGLGIAPGAGPEGVAPPKRGALVPCPVARRNGPTPVRTGAPDPDGQRLGPSPTAPRRAGPADGGIAPRSALEDPPPPPAPPPFVWPRPVRHAGGGGGGGNGGGALGPAPARP